MNAVRVRMFRQGLGDCFLLSFPGQAKQTHVLIDCGVLMGTTDSTPRMMSVAQSIRETTGGQIDALVVTHQHWDHVSGFLQAQQTFEKFFFKEVWLAWTEDPADELARNLGERKKLAFQAVTAAARHLADQSAFGAGRVAQRLTALLDFYGERSDIGRRTTSQAMEWIRARKGTRLRYFQPGSEPVTLPDVPNVQVFVLGPSRDPLMLRKNNPSRKASEVYELAGLEGSEAGFMAAVNAFGVDQSNARQPFDKWFQINETEAWETDWFVDHYGFENEGSDGWRRIEKDWLGIASQLALQLDSHTNNTSLVLAFELSPSGRVLLFPGDAQVGNWLSWAGREWQVQEGEKIRIVTTRDLLARTVLYKVGHHGSHNATLRDQGLELMSSRELTAMLPISRLTAKKKNWNMPFPGLYTRLLEKTNGRILDLETGLPEQPYNGASDTEWERFLSRTKVHPEWLEYSVDF
jgi:hypothetical protein